MMTAVCARDHVGRAERADRADRDGLLALGGVDAARDLVRVGQPHGLGLEPPDEQHLSEPLPQLFRGYRIRLRRLLDVGALIGHAWPPSAQARKAPNSWLNAARMSAARSPSNSRGSTFSVAVSVGRTVGVSSTTTGRGRTLPTVSSNCCPTAMTAVNASTPREPRLDSEAIGSLARSAPFSLPSRPRWTAALRAAAS